MPILSDAFQRLYCDPALFERFSAFHPVSFARVLPFQPEDPVADDPQLLTAETAHLANPNDASRLAIVEAFGQCGLLSDVASLKSVVDPFDTDFFEFMGEVYGNAGMYICALRWHREFIVELEERRPNSVSDHESVYASVGYCLYSLGLYPEAITWSKSCIGPRQTIDAVSQALIDYEARSQGGCIQAVEGAANRTRYTVSTSNPQQAAESTSRLKEALSGFAPIQETYIDWVHSDASNPRLTSDHQFSEPLTRHHTNLVFSLSARADELAAHGYTAEAKRLLLEADIFGAESEFFSL